MQKTTMVFIPRYKGLLSISLQPILAKILRRAKQGTGMDWETCEPQKEMDPNFFRISARAKSIGIHLCTYQSMYIYIYIFSYLSIHRSIYLSIYVPIYLSGYLAIPLNSTYNIQKPEVWSFCCGSSLLIITCNEVA